MKISVKAKPNAKEERVEKIDASHFIVAVKEPPRDGKANTAIAKALAAYFDISASRVQLTSGFSAKQKMFEIIEG